MQEDTIRSLWIGWGIGFIMLGLGLIPTGKWIWVGSCLIIGVAAVLRGYFPQWFQRSRRAKVNAANEHELPANRPRVTPIRFGSYQDAFGRGMLIDNAGDGAHDVSIEAFSLGRWSVAFERVNRLPRGEEVFLKVLASDNGNSTLDLSAPLLEWQRAAGILGIPVPFGIIYKDFDGQWYRSVCELELDVTSASGISVKFIRQEAIPKPA